MDKSIFMECSLVFIILFPLKIGENFWHWSRGQNLTATELYFRISFTYDILEFLWSLRVYSWRSKNQINNLGVWNDTTNTVLGSWHGKSWKKKSKQSIHVANTKVEAWTINGTKTLTMVIKIGINVCNALDFSSVLYNSDHDWKGWLP